MEKSNKCSKLLPYHIIAAAASGDDPVCTGFDLRPAKTLSAVRDPVQIEIVCKTENHNSYAPNRDLCLDYKKVFDKRKREAENRIESARLRQVIRGFAAEKSNTFC